MNGMIKTAVFPVAGLGTRFLPVTKAGPKEMLPIVDKPIIQYVVEEALAAGVTQLIFVTSSSKRAIEDYFDSNYELESRLEQKGKYDALQVVKNIIPKEVSIVYVRQAAPLGLGDAVLRAKDIVGNQPFAVLLPDDIMVEPNGTSCLQQMVALFSEVKSSLLAVQKIPLEQTDKYGIVSLCGQHKDQVAGIIEKPKPEDAPSDLAVTGRYILTPRIFELLEKTPKGVGGEIQLTDAIAALLKEERVHTYHFMGNRYDCGSRMGFLEATIAFALKRPDLKDRLTSYLQTILEKSISTAA